jgi:hypothetical protein
MIKIHNSQGDDNIIADTIFKFNLQIIIDKTFIGK